MKKAKDVQAAAGKNSGMSGRDLVCILSFYRSMLLTLMCSSLTTPSGLQTRMKTREKNGTSRNIAEKLRQSMTHKKLLALLHLTLTTMVIGKRPSSLQTKAHECMPTSLRMTLDILDKILCMYVVRYRVTSPSMAQETLQVSLENMYK